MSFREVSSVLQLKAKRELNEVPERIEQDINHIREWLSKQPHLKCRTDDQWLLTFLRGCKFSLERTKEKLDFFYTIRTMTPEFFSNRDPFQPEIQEVLKRGIILVLPKPANPEGPRLILANSKFLDPDVASATACLKVGSMILDILCIEDDQCVIAGKTGIVDWIDMPYKFIKQITPSLVKKTVVCIQSAYPTRLKELHFINAPLFVEYIFGLIKVFLNEKMRNRVHFNSNSKILYQIIPPSVLPKDYGGEGPSCAEIAAEWKQKIESYRNWFLEEEQYCSDETKRLGKPKTTADLFGVEGSFRKLEID